MMERREFLGGLAAAGVTAVSAPEVFAAPDDLLLKLGVVSDIHIGGRKEAPKRLTFAFEWLKAHGVEAVLCADDIAASGNIREFETFAAIWRSVFGDGRKVELMISTGNHDVAPWPGFYKDMTESERLAQQFGYKDNPARVWERLFGEKWELVWRKDVKGVTFVGSQWRTLHPPIERYMGARERIRPVRAVLLLPARPSGRNLPRRTRPADVPSLRSPMRISGDPQGGLLPNGTRDWLPMVYEFTTPKDMPPDAKCPFYFRTILAHGMAWRDRRAA